MDTASTEVHNTEQPITEQSNRLSTNIDTASHTEIASILYACDQEIFSGWNGSKGLNDGLVHGKMENIAQRIADVIQAQCGSVIISGCGTSGRLAFLTAQTFNRYLRLLGRPECFQYLIAGGDQALFASVELAEDDPTAGVQALRQASANKSMVVYIGVTCGMSAPFIAGQLDYCLSHMDIFTPVLLGFNPAHQARNVFMENWDKTFLQVVQKMEAAEKSLQAFILNPIIGPEPITGSSRMKSGTATRILLDIMSIAAIHKYPSHIISELVNMYETCCHTVYKHSEDLGSLIQLAGSCLLTGGHVYYLGKDGFGLTGMIDASECVPTFGASFHDIRGFVDGGFSQLQTNEGDISHMGPQYRISDVTFLEDIIPNLLPNDLVVFLGKDCLLKFETALSTLPCKKAAVLLTCNNEQITRETQTCDLLLTIHSDLSPLNTWKPDSVKELMSGLLLETSLKWVVNNLSTGAYIFCGKVYHNKMVDVRLSNSKLFHRAAGIVQTFCNLSAEESREFLLRSIYSTDCLSQEHRSSQVGHHILAASQKNKVVPTAILLATLQCTVKEAQNLIQKQPIISKLLNACDKTANQQQAS